LIVTCSPLVSQANASVATDFPENFWKTVSSAVEKFRKYK